ncbi:MAG: hypothetical protein LIO77_03655 [Rikenellaceae bacterium]|nr:hypothetical protein [Rikenellaceae bacterium]
MVIRDGKLEVNTIHSDFRSDVIAACIAESGAAIDNISILRGGTHDRQTDKEITSLERHRDYEAGTENILIKTNRRGIYDNLPEGLFYTPERMRNSNKETILDNIRTHNKEEFFIRRFFSLFESEMDRSRVRIRVQELKYDLPEKYRDLVDTMSGFWPIVKEMDTVSAVLFLKSVPYLSEIRNSFNEISRTLTTILGYNVNISVESRDFHPEIKFPRLGAMKLGIDSVLKGKTPQRQAVVRVQPSVSSLGDLLPGRPKRRMLEILLDIFLPDGILTQINITPEPEDYTARLGNRLHPCILGVNARLAGPGNIE